MSMKNFANLSTILSLLPVNARPLVVLLALPLLVLPLLAGGAALGGAPAWVLALVLVLWLMLLSVGVIATVVIALRPDPPPNGT